jgi:predicted Zn-dependent peptidase
MGHTATAEAGSGGLTATEHRLANGLRVVLSEDHLTPVAAVCLWYDVGSRHEVKGRTGLAHLFEHLMFQGSAQVKGNGHFELVQGAGGSLNGTTSFERTNYFETMPAHQLELALWLEADRMGSLLAALDDESMENQRDVVKNERRQRYDNVPYGTAFERLLHLAYPDDYSYHWPTIGSMEDLGAASVDDVRDFFSTWYRPDNCTLTIVGDFSPGEAKQLVEQYFGDIAPGGTFPPFDLERTPASHEVRETFASPVQLPRIYRLYHLPKMGEPDWVHADLLTTVLAADKASRLDRALVHEQQIAQDVAVYVLPTEATGILMLQATAREGVQIEEVEASIDAEVARLALDGITADELTRAKTRAEIDVAHQLETFDARADLIGMMATYFGDPAKVDRWLDPYRAATADDLAHVARKYLIPENRVTSLFVPES